MGCGFVNVVDENNRVFSWGDNYGGQLGTKDDIHREDPFLMKSLGDVTIKQVSLGFQHGLYLTDEGQVYGVGKNNRFQLGAEFNMNTSNNEIFDKYQPAKLLFDEDYFNEPVKSVHAGKFHSIIVTESDRMFGIGYNKYGQVGISNSMYLHAEEPVEIFTDDIKIKQVAVGAHHTLVLDHDGNVFGFGARNNG
jgi:alpha-tubulin suppressor-like RCC1 family protein